MTDNLLEKTHLEIKSLSCIALDGESSFVEGHDLLYDGESNSETPIVSGAS